MAIKMKASKNATEEAAAAVDFEQAPVGLYVIKLKSLTPKFAKTDGKEDTSRPYVEAQWQIVGVTRDNNPPMKDGKPINYSGLFDNVSFSEDSEWKRAQYCVALGKKSIRGEFNLEENPDKPGTDIGKLALGRVKKDSDQEGNYRAKLGTIFAYDTDGAGDIAEGSEAPDPFGNEPEEGGEEEGGETEYLTREFLEGLEPKELVPHMESFDLDPKSFKGKTAIADAIDAILEAQGMGDDGTGAPEPEDEGPF